MGKPTVVSKRCSICQSADRNAVDTLLARGAEYCATARKFGLSSHAVRRHFIDHVPEDWKTAIRLGGSATRDELERLCTEQGFTVVEGLRALYVSHYPMLLANRDTGAVHAYIAVAREMRGILNDIGRLTGELMPQVQSVSITNNFNTMTYIAGLGEELVAELADIPGALDRVHRVLQRRMTVAPALPSPAMLEGEFAHAG